MIFLDAYNNILKFFYFCLDLQTIKYFVERIYKISNVNNNINNKIIINAADIARNLIFK